MVQFRVLGLGIPIFNFRAIYVKLQGQAIILKVVIRTKKNSMYEKERRGRKRTSWVDVKASRRTSRFPAHS